MSVGQGHQMASDVDRVNRRVWSSTETLRLFADRDGFIDAGEALVTQRVATEARGQPILDIGVGGGRTTGHLRLLSDDYVGIDYLQEMVELTRARHPGARIERGDARDLKAFGDATFTLVFFSF